MTDELDKWAADVLDEAARTVPPELTTERVQGSGHAGPAILSELKRGGYDLVVLGTRGRGRTQEGLLGSVNGYIHFHAQVPLLSVPDKSQYMGCRGCRLWVHRVVVNVRRGEFSQLDAFLSYL